MRRISAGDAEANRYDLCVVGAGAAGLSLAFAARRSGLSVLVVERGGVAAEADPARAEIGDDVPHDPLCRANFMGLGGTLNRWGRRCVPFDPADFEIKPQGRPSWPIGYDEYRRWVPGACAFLGVEDDFAPGAPTGWQELENVGVDTVERLSPADLLRSVLRDESGVPDLLLGATVLGFDWADRRVQGVRVRVAGGQEVVIRADAVALACGGLHATRLLLSEEARHPRRFAGHDQIGRSYVGHLTGSIATIRFARLGDVAAFAYSAAAAGSPARRRFLVTPQSGAGVAIWVENLPKRDVRHRSGELSLKALAEGTVPNPREHVVNVLRDLLGTGTGILSALRRRVRPGRWHPNRLIARGPGPYRLAYHAEHLPHPQSRVTLASGLDRDGLPRLRIEFEYGRNTLETVVTAHRTLARDLRAAELAEVALDGDFDEMVRSVRAQARDGYHQIGLTRMSLGPEDGVVDRDCRVHGTENLYVAAASVFPVSGQANPTLSVVALALRLADVIAQRRHGKMVA